VVLVARRQAPLDAVAAELGDPERLLVVASDVTDLASIQRMVDTAISRFGPIDILVNNAGAHFRGPVATRTAEELARMVDVNLRAPVALSRMVLPGMVERKRGAIIGVASLAGKIPLAGSATYSSTKWGLRTFGFALAEELRGTGVTVSAVSPGPISTGFIQDDLDNVTDITFSQAMCTADDVARMVEDCARDGRRERAWPVSGSKLATLGYLAPWLRRWLRPALEARGRRAKAALKARLRG
jgi:short-subunit dehydrogenase